MTLLALWDRQAGGDVPGGVAHMVELARQSGRIHVREIDASRLAP